MSIFGRDPDVFYAEGDDVTVYPCAAEDVAAYVNAGLTGATVRGLFYVRDDLADNGDVAVEVEQPIFECTVDAAGDMAPYSHAIVYDDVTYAIVRRVFKDPSFYEFYLEALV